MKIQLPITYRWSVLLGVLFSLICLGLGFGFLAKGIWFGFIWMGSFWGLLLTPWFVIKLTLSEENISYRTFLGTQELKWASIRRIEMRGKIFFWFESPVWIEPSKWQYYRLRYLTLVGDQSDDAVTIPYNFKSIDLMREILAIIEAKAPQAQKDPLVPKYFDRTFL